LGGQQKYGEYRMGRAAGETGRMYRDLYVCVREVWMEHRGLRWVGIQNMRSQNPQVEQEGDNWCLERQPAV
jgi:hypothetical protein